MRIPRSWVPIMAAKIVDNLIEKELIGPKVSKHELTIAAEEIIMEELTVEDRLNDEVRNMLEQYEREIDTNRLDYKKLFDMTKQKLVRERNIIL